MIKINYPSNSKRNLLESEYYHTIISQLNEVAINRFLRNIIYDGNPLNLEILIKSHFSELIEILKTIEQYYTDENISQIRIQNFEKRFNYKKSQPRIANFFMTQDEVNISTCYYCNIDFINAFRDISDYRDALDFVNNASKKELLSIRLIGENKALKIINHRTGNTINSLEELGFSESIKRELLNFNIQNDSNHFTLDHVIPQSKYKYLSLSLYNFVPSCYSCNSKFKKDKEISNIDNLKYISPSSDDFTLNSDVTFKVYYKSSLEHISQNSDFVLKEQIHNNNSMISEYLEIFKINARYVFHKSKIKSLIQKKVRYPNSKIKHISELTGITQSQIKKDIFGKELFDIVNNEPLSKLRKDIAKNLNIINR